MNRHWTPKIEAAAALTRSYNELGGIGLMLATKASADYGFAVALGMVSGPISTGGLGSVEENMKAFQATILNLELLRIPLFDQTPFEPDMWRIAESQGEKHNQQELLEGFYLPILTSRRIGTLYFINGWEGSNGATWEHGKAIELGLGRVFLPKDFHLLQIRQG